MHPHLIAIQKKIINIKKQDFFRITVRHTQMCWYSIAGFLFLTFCSLVLFFLPPLGEVRYPQVFIVSKGETVRAIGEDLRRRNVINSPFLFILSNYVFGGKIVWGSYHFSKPRGVFFHARDLYFGEQNMPLRKVKIPERSDAYKMADIFEKEFPDFNREEFLEAALTHHGYLYPDTYLFAHSYVSANHLIEIMTETFNQRTNNLFASYTGDLTRDEIVTLASIVDLEASRFEDRRKIAQVLLNRLEINMPLQVDVSFLFIDDKHTFQLSHDDLNSNDPSNTYKYAGIPPIPVTNPDRESIEAVINPIETDALYFLADFYGNTYYSRTFEEHLMKKFKYIDSVRKKNGGNIPVTPKATNEQQTEGITIPDEIPESVPDERQDVDIEAEQASGQGVTDTINKSDDGGLGTPNLVILESGAVLMRE